VKSRPRWRRLITGLALCVIALAVFAATVALFLLCLVGIALLIAGLASWLHPIDVAAAWARTLGGIGLIGGSAGVAALGWMGVERLTGPLADFAGLPHRGRPAPAQGESALQRARKFVAVVGILLALICLPFAAALHATAHAPWLEWGRGTRRYDLSDPNGEGARMRP
jgi:hypothetical protein